MRIFLVVLFVLLISGTFTKPRSLQKSRHMKKGSPRDPCLPSRFNRKPRIRCKTSTRKPPTRKPPTRKPPRPRQKLDNNGRKIDANVRKINAILADGRKIEAILENVSDLKNNTRKRMMNMNMSLGNMGLDMNGMNVMDYLPATVRKRRAS